MNRFTQRVPNWSDLDPIEFDFDTLSELLSNETIQNYLAADPTYNFQMSVDDKLLMLVSPDELRWIAVGFLDNLDGINIPPWLGGRYWIRYPNGDETIVSSDQVKSSSGDTITLIDDTVCTKVETE